VSPFRGSDDGFEYAEMFDDDGVTESFELFSLGWGGADDTFGTPDLPDGFLVAAGVGLFDVDHSQIASSIPQAPFPLMHSSTARPSSLATRTTSSMRPVL
jgi:hypothetical protein